MKRVAIILPAEVQGINDTQRAFGPGGDHLSTLVANSEFVEVEVERNRLGPETVEIRVSSGWEVVA